MKTQVLVDKKDRRIIARHLQPAKSMISNCSANRKQILQNNRRQNRQRLFWHKKFAAKLGVTVQISKFHHLSKLENRAVARTRVAKEHTTYQLCQTVPHTVLTLP
jgi:hypothetical protein